MGWKLYSSIVRDAASNPKGSFHRTPKKKSHSENSWGATEACAAFSPSDRQYRVRWRRERAPLAFPLPRDLLLFGIRDCPIVEHQSCTPAPATRSPVNNGLPHVDERTKRSVMHFIVQPINGHWKVLALLSFALAVIVVAAVLRSKHSNEPPTSGNWRDNEHTRRPATNATASEKHKKTQRKEYLYGLLTNATRSLIQMEIKARRLEENMRRIKEKTADLLWKNKDKALWHILFKNISRHISIRHELHQHMTLNRIMHDHPHKHTARWNVILRYV